MHTHNQSQFKFYVHTHQKKVYMAIPYVIQDTYRIRISQVYSSTSRIYFKVLLLDSWYPTTPPPSQFFLSCVLVLYPPPALALDPFKPLTLLVNIPYPRSSFRRITGDGGDSKREREGDSRETKNASTYVLLSLCKRSERTSLRHIGRQDVKPRALNFVITTFPPW